ncbi:ABC transporter substrate-binding protein [Propionibacterium freudenreichii]|uniref:ABC transporter substrate-binding protein n=1 Tax=Propionibacterium freudenreichii TaxID=1744 RepID=UPI000BC31127|nr:ABC transporter substrate-binding protein [Propionibacterium freudenreichii]MDK9295173.1 ABC transporter substrate-binding protein [Propionibacterium freudenreichii]MDK9360542.1 ABC transporter substrate-binding protein [Propionibacterium freudenreichii]MDK9638673.1 ABC transporter substrate-binding protein [Propionibacterium freudenreichii]MDK9660093.1 ABC transporter substrate-binding protein [Propionibacterium freudenreichii]WGU91414.1 ABC transporter substrate-binding protein [Propionib
MRRAVSAVLAAVVGLGMVACGPNKVNSAVGDTVKIGVNYELSGTVASYGSSNVKGIEMAIDEINAAGGVRGKQLKEVKYDSKSEPAEATTLATKLTSQDKVVTIIGPATSGSFKATIPVANKHEVPVVSGSATANDATVLHGKVQPYAFRTCFSDNYQGTGMADYAVKRMKATRAVIIKDNSSDYSKGLAESFRQKMTEEGGTITNEVTYNTGDQDFNAILTSIKNQKFDVIYLPGYYAEAGLIIKQARAQGIDTPILGGDGWDSPKLEDLAGDSALNNVFFSNHYSSLDPSAQVQDFIKAYKARYGAEPDAFNALGYDTAKFVADSINRASSIDGPSIAQAMATTTNFSGVTGTFSMDANHNPVKSIVVVGLTNGKQASSESYKAS